MTSASRLGVARARPDAGQLGPAFTASRTPAPPATRQLRAAPPPAATLRLLAGLDRSNVARPAGSSPTDAPASLPSVGCAPLQTFPGRPRGKRPSGCGLRSRACGRQLHTGRRRATAGHGGCEDPAQCVVLDGRQVSLCRYPPTPVRRRHSIQPVQTRPQPRPAGSRPPPANRRRGVRRPRSRAARGRPRWFRPAHPRRAPSRSRTGRQGPLQPRPPGTDFVERAWRVSCGLHYYLRLFNQRYVMENRQRNE